MTKNKTYTTTHPWLTFQANLARLPYNVWVMLGECRSKCEHISRVPLRPDTAQRLHLLYFAKGVHATTAIEGNTLTEQEVLQRMKGELKLPPSREYLGKEIDNMIKACKLVAKEIVEGKVSPLNPFRIKKLNQLVLDKLKVEEWVIPGIIRTQKVGVSRYMAPPPEECGFLLQKLCDWLNGKEFVPPKGLGLETVFAILKAIIAHLYLAWIHPFGNGRTARLIEFQILLSSGIPAPAAHLLSNHYNYTRTEYYRQLDYAGKSGGNIIPFITYAIRGYVDGLQMQLEDIHNQQA